MYDTVTCAYMFYINPLLFSLKKTLKIQEFLARMGIELIRNSKNGFLLNVERRNLLVVLHRLFATMNEINFPILFFSYIGLNNSTPL